MQQWIEQHLIDQGVISASGIGRRVVLRRCRACSVWTFQGLDADTMAGEAVTELYPLDALGEATALFGGLKTYNLTYRGDHYELDWRNPIEVQGNAPGSQVGVDVVHEHKCGVHIRTAQGTNIRKRMSKSRSECFEEPPF